MLKNSSKRNQGFTIIEVLIVLAIAGLILLIVFLAVPALQRNSRNTQRKNDVAAVLGAVNEWSNNNNGKVPKDDAELKIALKNANLGPYDNKVDFDKAPADNPDNTDKMTLVVEASCDANGNAKGGSSREIVALYTVETGGGKQPICQGS